MRHAIEFGQGVAVLRMVVPAADALGAPWLEGDPRGRPREARQTYVAGRVNGKPFLAGLRVSPALGPPYFTLTGHLLDANEERALRRAVEGAPARIVDLRDGDGRSQRAEREHRAALEREAYVFLDVPDRGANARLKALGGMWHGDERCWFVMAGIDMAPVAALGATPRPRPEWRRVEGVTREGAAVRERAKALGARWLDPAWRVDVAACDPEAIREMREDLGLRIMETQADLWAWKDVNGFNAEPPADAFPEWVPEGPVPGPR